jgi:L-ascorbate metabolism protein UlaG (beta-lactamase superfamily)
MDPWLAAHFKHSRFFNPGVPPQRFSQVIKWITHRKVGPWRNFVQSVRGPKPPAYVDGSQLRATFVNHATFLLQTEGYNLLTDPVWSERVSPIRFLGPRRHRDPGITFEDLPRIHCILISHNHYDHLDVPTLRRLVARDRPAIFCPLGVAKLLKRIGFQEIYELDWWQVQTWGHMRIHCVPAQHFSSRTPFDRNRTLWCGWVMEATGGGIYFAGDTGFGHHFNAIRDKFESLRLALLPIGAYMPEWFMGSVHMTPEQAVEAHSILEASTAIAIHFGTFSLADDGEAEPVDRLRIALTSTKQEWPFWILGEGEGRGVPELSISTARSTARDRPRPSQIREEEGRR